MRLLLDTHTLIWATVEPRRLSVLAERLLVDPSNIRVVSSVTAWEIATKFRLGKLSQVENLVRDYEQHMRTFEAQELGVTTAHALLAGSLGWAHKDPFDRLLAAQALIEGLPLITNDPIFAANGVPTLW